MIAGEKRKQLPRPLRRAKTVQEGDMPVTLIHVHGNAPVMRCEVCRSFAPTRVLNTSEITYYNDKEVLKKASMYKSSPLDVPIRSVLQKSCESLNEPTMPPPPEALIARRDALVPEETKVFDDSSKEENGNDDTNGTHCDNVIIIPQMQVSPNELHLYNRAITRGSILTELQKATTAAQAFYSEDSRKPKAPWIFKRLYEWSHRAKAREVVRHVRGALARADTEFFDDDLMALLNKNWTHMYGSSTDRIPEVERKRLQAVWELFHTELTFLYQHLLALRNVFKEPLKECQVEGYLLTVEPELLFGNLEELCQVSFAFCKEFHRTLLQSLEDGRFGHTDTVAAIFSKFSKTVSPIATYQAYCINYKATMEYLENIRKTDDRFIEFEKLCAQDPRCNRLQLEDLLITPLHRITRLPLLLKEILKYTVAPEERLTVEGIIAMIHESLLSIDESIQWLHNFERLQELQNQLAWPPIAELDPKTFVPEFLKLAISRQFCENLLAHPRRKLLHEGVLHCVENQKNIEVYAFLFNDMLLLTKSKKGTARSKQLKPGLAAEDCRSADPTYRFVVQKQPVPLDSCVFCDVGPQDITNTCLKHAFVVLHLTRFYQLVAVYTFQAPTKEAKETWIRKFQESIENYESIQLKDMLRCTPLISANRTPSRSPSRRPSHIVREKGTQTATENGFQSSRDPSPTLV